MMTASDAVGERRDQLTGWLTGIAVAAGLSSFVLGLIVMHGWHTNNVVLIQVFPAFVPMQYNTTVGFVLCGLALLFAIRDRPRLAATAGIMVAMLGILTLVEYAFSVDLGIDELLQEHYITVQTSHPGRMAPNTAICFTLLGLALISCSMAARWINRSLVPVILGSLAFGLAAVTLSGYLVKIETAYGWGHLTRMAIHTAIGFLAMGIGVICLIWRRDLLHDAILPRWFPVPIGVSVLTGAVCFWQAIKAEFAEIGKTGILSEGDSHIPQVLLIVGTLLALGLALAAYEALAAMRRTVELESAKLVLAAEVADRTKAEETLKRKEYYLSRAQEIGLVGTWELDVVNNALTWTDENYRIFGVPIGTPLTYITFLDCVHPEDRKYVHQQWTKGMNHEPYDIEHRLLVDGKVKWVREKAEVTYDENRNPVKAIGFTQDITDRKRAESDRETTIALLEVLNVKNDLHGLMRTVLSFMQEWSDCEAVGIRLRDGDDFPYYETKGLSDEFLALERQLCARDLNGQLRRDELGNPMLECMCGNIICGRFDPSKPFFTDHGSFVSTSTSELLASMGEEDRQSHRLNRCNSAGYESVALIPLRSGAETFGLLQFNAPRKGHFSPEFIALAERLADDVALALAQRQAEEALRSEKLLSEEYINSLPGLFYVFDERRFARWNAEWKRVTGCSEEELADKYLTDFVEGEDRTLIAERMLKVFREGRADAEAELVTKDGRRIPYYFTGLRKELGGKSYLVGVGMDITKRTQAEREREELIAKLESQNAELERFTYTVSHDLKSPLITIMGHVGILRQDLTEGDPGQVEDDLARISNAAEKMDELLRDLLELSRIGRLVNPPQDVSLEELADEAIELVGGQIKKKGVQVEISPGLPVVFGDRLRLLEVMQNAIDNATKYMGDQPQPRIEIFTRPDDKGPVFCVRDNGIGIDPDYHEKVFGLFDQLDRNAEGSGVGLALVKRIVEVHGGRTWIESEGSGYGSTFCFTIPARTESQDFEPCATVGHGKHSKTHGT